MTQLLEKAFAEAQRLPAAAQDELADEILQELDWERRWDQTLTGSAEAVDRLAEKALREYQAGARAH